MKNLLLSLFCCALSPILGSAQKNTQTENLIVITLDGLRWQEVFGGADSALIFNPQYTHDSAYYVSKYWLQTPEMRRSTLMPFLWSTFMKDGQLYGNRKYDNKVNVANGMWFSYPGYNEIFTGNPDDKNINSNDKIQNPNTNVLEFLNKQKEMEGRIAAFSSWNVFPWILNENRSKILVNSGFENLEKVNDPVVNTLNKLQHNQPKYWLDGVRMDFLTFAMARRYAQVKHPRLLFIGLDETDDYAHDGRYDFYLSAANQIDGWIAELWDFVQHDPAYRDKTTLLITCDHGRGDKVKSEWRDHGSKVDGSDQIWFAVIGPDTKPIGEVKQPAQLFQKQFAQTMAHFLGHNFTCEHSVAPAIDAVIGK